MSIGSNNLLIGSHLISKREYYTHHGLYAGDGRVIHYSGHSDSRVAGPVCYVSLQQFERGFGYSVIDHPLRTYSNMHSLARAESRLGEEYNVSLL